MYNTVYSTYMPSSTGQERVYGVLHSETHAGDINCGMNAMLVHVREVPTRAWRQGRGGRDCYRTVFRKSGVG